MRYSYGITSALLAGGAAISLITGYPAGAQVAQNDAAHMEHVTPRAGAPSSFADLTEQLQPAVVNIATKQRITVSNNPFAGTPFAEMFGNRGRPTTREAQSLGSGFIVSADGYVVTNNHVIAAEGGGEVEEITVSTTDGTEYPAELVGRDADSDLAVLKIKSNKPFKFVKFGDSAHARVGDWVIAIGNPFGLGGTVTAGIISAVYRNTGQLGAYDRYIQTDASINRGNSGGPLFDMEGNVIGINNAIYSPSGGSVGIGFAIPAEIASPIVDKLISGEEIKRGYLGVLIGPVSEDMSDALGIPENHGEFVQSVTSDGPADKAGLQPGDVVMKVDGQDVTPDQSLSYLVANIEPGKRIPVEINRNGKRQNITITVGERPSQEELAKQTFDPDSQDLGSQPAPSAGPGIIENALGLRAIPLNAQIARQLGASADTKGVVVTVVDPSSDAGQKGLQRGDIVLTANYQRIESVEDLEKVVKAAQAEGREAVLLRVQRRGQQAAFVPVRLNTPNKK